MPERGLEARLKALGILLISVFALLTARLWYLQVAQGEQYAQLADYNRIRPVPLRAPRGAIRDSSGKPIVGNRPSYTVSVVPLDLPESERARVVGVLARLLSIPEVEIEKTIQEGRAYPFTPVRLRRDVSHEIVLALEEQRVNLPGLLVEEEWTRQYPYTDLASQTLGYLGAVDKEDLKKGYKPTDFIGKTGLERTYEEYLRGVDGQRRVEVNALSQPVRELATIDPLPGNDLYLTIDLDLQLAAEEAMKAHLSRLRTSSRYTKAGSGAVVALDARTGAILAMVSQPGYDLAKLHSDERSAYVATLNSDPRQPFINRAISEYPPGSTFKPITGLTALNAGSLQPDEIYNATGYGKYGKRDWTLRSSPPQPPAGRVNIAGALTRSANDFFWEIALRPGTGGIDAIANMARSFGLGQPTGLKLYPGEKSGLVPDKDWKKKVYRQSWYEAETMDVAIGQGYLMLTPLQLASVYMTIANRGVAYKPYLLSRVMSPEGELLASFEPQQARRLNIQDSHWDAVIEGLRAVVQSSRGTAAGSFWGAKYDPAGKTGSSQVTGQPAHAWFASFAPAAQPEIVVVVFAEYGEGGSSAAAPIARKVLDAYFTKHPIEKPR